MRERSPYLDVDVARDDDAATGTSVARGGNRGGSSNGEALAHASISLRDFAHDGASAPARRRLIDDGLGPPQPDEPSSDDDDDDDDNDDDDGKGHSRGPRRPSSPLLPTPSTLGRYVSPFHDSTPPLLPPPPPSNPHSPPPKPTAAAPVTWRSLPHKPQLTILTLARLSEPLTQTSLQSYIFYQLASFAPDLPASTIAAQAGLLAGAFTGAQMLTAILWGRVADAAWGGRKAVVLVGLLGTALGCVGVGFGASFGALVGWRALGGALNGNVGVMRTVVAEVVRERRFQSRAFLLMPMCFNVGVIVGPVLGGVLADPVGNHPRLFGEHSLLGGVDGVGWMKRWPYALPNLLSAVFLGSAALGVFLGLEETLDSLRHRPDLGIRLRRSIARFFRTHILRRDKHTYTSLPSNSPSSPPLTPHRSSDLESQAKSPAPKSPKPPFSSLLTAPILTVLTSHFLLAMHVGTFNSLWSIFLATPRAPPSSPTHLPLIFTGGLGFPPATIGLAMSILGAIGITLQLFLYPWVSHKLGTVRCYRYSLCLFPLTYLLAPFLAAIHSSTSRSEGGPATGALVWAALAGVLLVQTMARTFALPANIILVNSQAQGTGLLGTLHGVAQSVSAGSRTLGPILGGWGYGVGLANGMVGAVWWSMMVIAMVGAAVGTFVKEKEEILSKDEMMEIEMEGEGEGEGEASRLMGERRESVEDQDSRLRASLDSKGAANNHSRR